MKKTISDKSSFKKNEHIGCCSSSRYKGLLCIYVICNRFLAILFSLFTFNVSKDFAFTI
jgi:hypothetical protein